MMGYSGFYSVDLFSIPFGMNYMWNSTSGGKLRDTFVTLLVGCHKRVQKITLAQGMPCTAHNTVFIGET
jgi:hypothetical protein